MSAGADVSPADVPSPERAERAALDETGGGTVTDTEGGDEDD